MNERAVHELLSDVNWALAQRLPKRDLLAMLKRLVESAEPGSPEEHFAKLELAGLIVERQPFRAARLAHDVLRYGPDDRAFAVLGIAHTVLGNFRAARRAYERALKLTPDDPGILHNLGHLLDVAFNRPDEALGHLAAACRALPDEVALASSHAHALARTGQKASAVRLLAQKSHLSRELAVATVEAWTRSP